MFTAITVFFSGIWGKISAQAIIVILILAMIGGAAGYFFYSQNEIKSIAAQLADVQQQNVLLKSDITALQKDQATVKVLTDQLNTNLSDIQQQTSKSISDILSQDFNTGAASSKVLQDKINKEWQQLQDSLSK